MNRRQLISVFFIALLIYILFNVLSILSPFAGPIFWGAIIAFTFFPLYEKVRRSLRDNANAAAALVTAVVLLTITPIAIMIVLLGLRETVHLYESLAEFIKSGGAERLYEKIRELYLVKKIVSLKIVPWETLGPQLNDWLLNSAGAIGNFVFKHATVLTKNIVQAILHFFLTFFLVFFLLRDGDKIYRFIYEITPLDEDNKSEIFRQLSETFSATLRGQLLTSITQASVLGTVFWVLHLPLPVFFAAAAFLASMVPLLGVASIWVPFVIYLFIKQELARAVALLVLGTIVISGIDNVLKPLVIGQKTKLPYPLLFLAILGGIQVYGFVGLFLAPAVLSLFFVLVKIYRNKFAAES